MYDYNRKLFNTNILLNKCFIEEFCNGINKINSMSTYLNINYLKCYMLQLDRESSVKLELYLNS